VNCTSAFPSSSVANGGNNALLLGPTAGDDPAISNITYMVTSNSRCGEEVPIYNSQTYGATQNHEATDPKWVNVTFGSPGSESSPPTGANFALATGSPAIGYGVTKPYLPASSVDAGACPSALVTCP